MIVNTVRCWVWSGVGLGFGAREGHSRVGTRSYKAILGRKGGGSGRWLQAVAQANVGRSIQAGAQACRALCCYVDLIEEVVYFYVGT
jgi:hypothetical protein